MKKYDQMSSDELDALVKESMRSYSFNSPTEHVVAVVLQQYAHWGVTEAQIQDATWNAIGSIAKLSRKCAEEVGEGHSFWYSTPESRARSILRSAIAVVLSVMLPEQFSGVEDSASAEIVQEVMESILVFAKGINQ